MRKLFFNIGFQFNYNEPFQLSSFYNATYFQNPFSKRDFKANEMDTTVRDNDIQTSTLDAMNNNQISTTVDLHNDVSSETIRLPKSIDTRSSEESHKFEQTNGGNQLIGADLTAAQLYEGVEEHLFK